LEIFSLFWQQTHRYRHEALDIEEGEKDLLARTRLAVFRTFVTVGLQNNLMITSQLPQSNALSLPPPLACFGASLAVDDEIRSSQLPQTSFDPASNHLSLTHKKRQSAPLDRRPSQKKPTAVGPWLAHSLDERWQCYQKQLGRFRRHLSEDSVHELRVATRRLMALFTLLSCVPDGAIGEKGRRVLKLQLKALNELRDTHVLRMFIEQQMPRFPELALVRDFLTRGERRLEKGLAAKLDRFKTRKLAKWINSLSAGLNRQPAERERQTQLLALALRGTAQAFSEVVARRELIDQTDLGSIHRTRVAFKRFRYMVECLSPAFTGLGKRQLRRLAMYQRKMGNVQDLEVMREYLDRFEQDHRGTDLLLRFRRQLQRRRTRSMRIFLQASDQLLRFWPPPGLANQLLAA
jgi:CHAD domain-containing protein